MLLIRNILNWSIRIILTVIVVWGILPYIPRYYKNNSIPNSRFPVLIVNSENKPEILRFEDWITTSPKPTLWTVVGNGDAFMGSMIFSYSVTILSSYRNNDEYSSNADSVVIKITRNNSDHIVSATYNINNNNFIPVRYHSMDPGIAFVFIFWLVAWGSLSIIRHLIFTILNRFAKQTHTSTLLICV